MNARLSRASTGRAPLLVIATLCLLAAWVAPPALAGSSVTGGAITLLTDPPQSEALFVGGVAPFFVAPATLHLTGDAWRFTFPIAGGSLSAASGAGRVRSRGGLVFWGRETMSSWTELSFTKPVVTTGAHAVLSGVYGPQGTRHVLATLDMSHAAVSRSHSGGHDWVRVGNVPARMSTWLRNQMTSVFPRYQPSADRLGTVTVKARLK